MSDRSPVIIRGPWSMSFVSIPEPGVVLWAGQPACQDAHDFLLGQITEICSGTFRPVPAQLDNILKGNLGECVAFIIGKENDFKKCHPFPANAFNPLGPIAKSDVDIIWLAIGETADLDMAVLQEVKTTSQPNIGLADRLVDDYDKLFGTNPAFTLSTRMAPIKNYIQYTLKRPEWLRRVSALTRSSPRECSQIKLVPTVVYDRLKTPDPRVKMLAIRTTLNGRGWGLATISSWAVGLSDLDSRLVRLAEGKS